MSRRNGLSLTHEGCHKPKFTQQHIPEIRKENKTFNNTPFKGYNQGQGITSSELIQLHSTLQQ